MAKSYKCKPFDHITKIAVKELQKVNRSKIWEANSKLQGKRKRENPNILYTKVSGIWSRKDPDTLEIPKPGKKVDKKASGKSHVYVVQTADLFLYLRILKDDFKPIPDNTEYSLEITEPDWTKDSLGWKVSKKTKKEHPQIEKGVIKVKIPPTAQKGTLTIRLKAEDTDDAKPADAGNGAVAADEDKNKANRGKVPVTWDLKIGALNPIGELAPDKNCTSGVQQRLNNLRFNSGPVDGRLGNKTKAAVAAFQSIFNIDVPKGKENNLDQIHTKLEEVHDTDKEVSVPEESGRIKDPSTAVSKKKKRPTKKKDIGHVAPSYGKFTTYNTLVIRPEYRISLELGNINDLFVHKENSLKGKMERMQVAALFYFPMNHKKATEAVNFGWDDWYKKKILKENDDKKAFEKLAKRIQNFVVDGGELPPPADDFNNPGPKNFKKLRFPGGYTCTDCKKVWSVFNPNHDDTTGWDPNDLKRGKPYKLGMTEEQVYDAELAHKHDNPVLGAIPLVALVEKRDEVDDKWKPAEGAMVYFQLVMPYELPKYNEKKSPRDQINRPDLRESDMQKKTKTGVGPKKLVDAAMNKEPPTKKGDPQADNCPEKHGGKRGLSVADNIFELKADLADHKRQIAKVPVHDWKPRPGFHAEHEDEPRKSQVKGPFYPEVKEPDEPDTHKYAVCAKTNKNGYAGVIFKPSTIGGDRYRLRAYVGPPTLKGPGSDGTGINAVSVETGTLVVWRNIRISKVSRMPCKTLAPALQTDIKTQFKGSTRGWRKDLFDKPEETLKDLTGVTKKDAKRTSVGLPNLDLTAEGDPKPRSHYKGLVYQMARSFCELELDPGIDPKKPATDLSEEEWRDALEAAVKYADNNSKKKNISVTASGLEIDVAKFVITDKSVKASNSFAAIPLRMPKVYNALVDSTSTPKLPVDTKNELRENPGPGDIGKWYLEYLVFPFVYALAHKGYLPGLFILQVTSISTLGATKQIFDFAGLGLQFRSCVLALGGDCYAPEPKVQYRDTANKIEKQHTGYNALALHEVGHCLFRDHAPPDPEPKNTDIHDKEGDGYCVMTYKLTEGDYCGKCLLAVQGWKDIKTLP